MGSFISYLVRLHTAIMLRDSLLAKVVHSYIYTLFPSLNVLLNRFYFTEPTEKSTTSSKTPSWPEQLARIKARNAPSTASNDSNVEDSTLTPNPKRRRKQTKDEENKQINKSVDESLKSKKYVRTTYL